MKWITPEIYYVAAVIGVIVFGAIAHSFRAFKNYRQNGQPFTKEDFVILSVLAAFSGTMAGLATFAVVSQNIIIVSFFAGLGAFAGMALLDRISVVFLDVFESILRSFTKK